MCAESPSCNNLALRLNARGCFLYHGRKFFCRKSMQVIELILILYGTPNKPPRVSWTMPVSVKSIQSARGGKNQFIDLHRLSAENLRAIVWETTSCIQPQGKVSIGRGPSTHCTPHQGLPWQDGLQRRPFNDVPFLLVWFKTDREPVVHSNATFMEMEDNLNPKVNCGQPFKRFASKYSPKKSSTSSKVLINVFLQLY